MQLKEPLEYPLTYWERISKTQWGRYISEIEKCAILQAHEYAGPPNTAFEVGCDGGRWSQLLSSLGWTMICTDVSQEAIAACQQRIPGADCKLVRADDTTLPCERGIVDLLLCIEVRSLVESEWFLSEAYRVLGNSGVLVGVTWNRNSLRGLRARMLNALKGGSDPFYRMSYSHWKKRLLQSGFRIVHERGLCWFPFSRDSNSFLIPLCGQFERWSRLSRFVSLSPWIVFIAQKQ